MSELNSVEAMRMFGIVANHIGAKPERKSISDRVMEFVGDLHDGGFVIVPARDVPASDHAAAGE